jgi:phosphotransacetylase
MIIGDFASLIAHAAGLPVQRVVVVNPSNEETFASIVDAHRQLGVECTLTGQQRVIEQGLAAAGGDGAGMDIVDCPTVAQALEAAIDIIRKGTGDILMKGSVDTSTMMKAALREESGLRTGRLLSDIFVLEYPERTGNTFVMITDGGMTLAPDLKNKMELIRNAVDVAHALGNTTPRVAVLSATEFVLPNLPSTLDAAALSKMNERGQIRGCIVDGPFALDNAISIEAAREKGIRSEVAGRADILLAANIESANSLAKSTTYFAGLPLAHVIVGARIPILIPSRADRAGARLSSIALGMVMREAARRGPEE